MLFLAVQKVERPQVLTHGVENHISKRSVTDTNLECLAASELSLVVTDPFDLERVVVGRDFGFTETMI